MREHHCHLSSRSIAVPGTETSDWTSGEYLDALKKAAKDADYVFATLMGNDALYHMPDCAKNHSKTAAECGDMLYAKAYANMAAMADAIHEASPNARFVGFGSRKVVCDVRCFVV